MAILGTEPLAMLPPLPGGVVQVKLQKPAFGDYASSNPVLGASRVSRFSVVSQNFACLAFWKEAVVWTLSLLLLPMISS